MKNKFFGQQNYQHGKSAKLGILVVNLGTPEAPTPSALRKYLAEFLSDQRVVELPRLLWMMILHGIILRTRPAKSAKAYEKVWQDGGSPLMVSSSLLTEEISAQLKQQIAGETKTLLAMRYGEPSIKSQLQKLHQDGAERILVLPLYPQYSGATIGSVADAVFAELSQWRWVPELRMMGAYHDDPEYIQAIANSIRLTWQEKKQPQKLLISFHGMPQDTLDKGDPYYCHCHKTARLIAQELTLTEDQWEMMFQSRFGKAKWLQPYVAERLEQLPQEGIKDVAMICPGFAVDCLETLEEIAIEGKKSFLAAGGKNFNYIPCLNSQQDHINLNVNRILKHASGWPELDPQLVQQSKSDREKNKPEK